MAKAEMRDRDMTDEAKEEAKEASEDGARDSEEPAGERKRGGAMKKHKRKSGGMVPGMMAKERPDRRARGGGTSDTNPLTSAGNVSSPSYLTKGSVDNGGGVGPDKSPYSGGGHRRPG